MVRRGADTEIAPVPFAEGAFTCEIQRWDEVTGAWIAVSGGHRAARPFAYELSAVTFFSPASVDDEWRWSGGLQLDASPNPFDRHAVLAFRLEERAPVRLRVLDSAGRVVATLLDNECTPGGHAVRWSGPDRLTGVSSGVYFAEIRTPAERRRVRLVHVR